MHIQNICNILLHPFLATDHHLQGAQQEILSYEKVIKVLQEELINMELRAQPYSRKQRDYYDEQFPSLQSKYDWI